MNSYIKEILDCENIEYAGIIPFSECKVINSDLLERKIAGWQPKSAIILLIPYYTGDYPERNVSLYAVVRDYHLYFSQLYERLEAVLSRQFRGKNFKGFADHSPIGETGAGAKAGLGVIGDKFQLINEKYGSYTFIGEILTDMEFDEYDLHTVKFCSHCGACSEACPSKDDCLSDMTQRRGELSKNAEKLIQMTGIAWGCDICRTSCPMNKNAAVTPISFFKEDIIAHISSDELSNMSKEQFMSRAYSWRGRNTIIRNLKTLEFAAKSKCNNDPGKL